MIEMLGKIEDCDSRSPQQNEILRAWRIFRDGVLRAGYAEMEVLDPVVKGGPNIFVLTHPYPLPPTMVNAYVGMVKKLAHVAEKLLSERTEPADEPNVIYDLYERKVYPPANPKHDMAFAALHLVLWWWLGLR